MKQKPHINIRFIERDYLFKKICVESPLLTYRQIDSILDPEWHWQDYTFEFYDDGGVTIKDNLTDSEIRVKDLTGHVLEFYVQYRMDQIKTKITNQQLQYA